MTELSPLNSTRYFCPSGICAANDCRCPKLAEGYPTVREWLKDSQHMRITLYMALIAAVGVAVYVYGVFNR